MDKFPGRIPALLKLSAPGTEEFDSMWNPSEMLAEFLDILLYSLTSGETGGIMVEFDQNINEIPASFRWTSGRIS